MKELEKGDEKVQKLCDILRRETIEPAQKEADAIIQEANVKAGQIIKDAEKQTAKMIDEARMQIEQQRNVFHSSLEQAASQSMEALRQSIEKKLFDPEVALVIQESAADPKVIARLIESIIAAIEREGIETNLSAIVANSVSADEVNRLLGERILTRLKEGSVAIGTFGAGAQIKLHDKKMTLDITDAALKELLSNFVRKDFRKLFFQTAKAE